MCSAAKGEGGLLAGLLDPNGVGVPPKAVVGAGVACTWVIPPKVLALAGMSSCRYFTFGVACLSRAGGDCWRH